jgi:hypothetical protein
MVLEVEIVQPYGAQRYMRRPAARQATHLKVVGLVREQVVTNRSTQCGQAAESHNLISFVVLPTGSAAER